MVVIDINFLPQEEKRKDLKKLRDELEAHYDCKVLLIDSSRSNTQGFYNTNPVMKLDEKDR